MTVYNQQEILAYSSMAVAGAVTVLAVTELLPVRYSLPVSIFAGLIFGVAVFVIGQRGELTNG